jgi:dTDP-4-dehydrorhamnose 3,5-epimerase
MKVTPAALSGAFILDLEPHADERGFFARSFCVDELAAAGLNPRVVQMNVSFNTRAGTLRGLHIQKDPHGETKIVRCTRGRIFDVIVDVRAGSPTRGRWCSLELDEENRRALYVPTGFAHGFQTLSDGAEVLYLMGSTYVKEAAGGFRYDDPAFGIAWPRPPAVISQRDLDYPPFGPS